MPAAAAADYTAAAREPGAVKAPTISGQSTVAPRVRAERDRNLTSMVRRHHLCLLQMWS